MFAFTEHAFAPFSPSLHLTHTIYIGIQTVDAFLGHLKGVDLLRISGLCTHNETVIMFSIDGNISV